MRTDDMLDMEGLAKEKNQAGTALPLARIKVLDLTQARAGPTCVRHLADWGADVIRIEQPPTEEERGEVVGKREGVDYQNLNRNKKAVTLNLKDKRGHALFMKLAKDADVIVENQRANVKFRLGVDYESVRKINPRIVYGSISGFGQEGPYADRAGLDNVVQGMSGLMSITGEPGGGPMRVGIAISDLTSGTYLALGIMIALFERERTGEGRWVTTSLLESLIAMLDFQAARWLNKKQVPGQEGNFHPTATPTGTYATTNGLITISAAGHRIWVRFCAAIGQPELAKHPKFATYETRAANRKELNETVAHYLSTRSTEEWVEILNEAGVPCGPVYRIDEMFEDPQVKFLNMARPVTHPKLGEQYMVAQGFNISGHSKDIRSPTPGVGEHTFEILGKLGLAESELEQLRSEGVI